MSKTGTTASFVYNAEGLRVQKTVNNVVTNYTLHGKNIVHMTQGSNTLHFWYDAQNRPAIVQFNGTKYAYIHNLQGDIIGIIDTNGTEVVKYTYDAWGKPLSTTGSLASTLGTIQPFRYRGYVYDVETGFYYLRARYYNPVTGRFISGDRVLHGNAFAYCNNNWIIYYDITGCNGTLAIFIYTTKDDFTYKGMQGSSGHAWIAYADSKGKTTTYSKWDETDGSGVWKNMEHGWHSLFKDGSILSKTKNNAAWVVFDISEEEEEKLMRYIEERKPDRWEETNSCTDFVRGALQETFGVFLGEKYDIPLFTNVLIDLINNCDYSRFIRVQNGNWDYKELEQEPGHIIEPEFIGIY